MEVVLFHLMPYADLDLSVKDKYRTVWIVLPNSYYDPKKGRDLQMVFKHCLPSQYILQLIEKK